MSLYCLCMYEIENFVERSGFFELYGIRKKLTICRMVIRSFDK